MDKIAMRDWVASLEEIIDNKLRKWLKETRIENGEVVHTEWQFENTHILLYIFWHDREEMVKLYCVGPRADHIFTWHHLNNQTFNRVQDRIGNLSQMIMYPVIIPKFPTDGEHP